MAEFGKKLIMQSWKVSSQPRNEIGVDALGQADTMIS